MVAKDVHALADGRGNFCHVFKNQEIVFVQKLFRNKFGQVASFNFQIVGRQFSKNVTVYFFIAENNQDFVKVANKTIFFIFDKVYDERRLSAVCARTQQIYRIGKKRSVIILTVFGKVHFATEPI